MSSSDPPAKLPVAPNMSQILNRISLGLAKHERILQTLKRPPQPTTPSTAQSKSTTSGFSSLAQPTAPSNKPGSANGVVSASREEEDRLFEQDRALPPNAGIGFVEERKAGEREGKGREDKMLRGRLLGKRGGGKDKGAERKRYVDESEEEEGRSGLGKKKKRRRIVGAVEGESNGVAGGGGEGADATNSEDVATVAKETPLVIEATAGGKEPQRDGNEESDGIADGDDPENSGGQTAGEPDLLDAAELAKAKKRKRKQAKKKRNKANKAQDEATTDAQPVPAAPHADE
ncbi:hypothetical protein BR93DRAFT_927930 [Coniochaeta sp. PMI_546]|nr:hypothetical protein BR93DRAFT_927930 [Coniochaeta sp. PMI_546]